MHSNLYFPALIIISVQIEQDSIDPKNRVLSEILCLKLLIPINLDVIKNVMILIKDIYKLDWIIDSFFLKNWLFYCLNFYLIDEF